MSFVRISASSFHSKKRLFLNKPQWFSCELGEIFRFVNDVFVRKIRPNRIVKAVFWSMTEVVFQKIGRLFRQNRRLLKKDGKLLLPISRRRVANERTEKTNFEDGRLRNSSFSKEYDDVFLYILSFWNFIQGCFGRIFERDFWISKYGRFEVEKR